MISKWQSALRYHSFFHLLALVCLSSAVQSKAIEPHTLADSLYAVGDYQPAITEYKRHLFFHQRDSKAAEIYYRIGLCFRNIQNWEKAVTAIRKAIDLSADDSLRVQYKMSLGIVHISSGDYSSAEMILLRPALFSKQQSVRTRASFFLALTYIYKNKWKEAKEYMEKTVLLSDSTTPEQLWQVLEKAVNIKYKSPSKAKWLSTFVPGLGQIYAGKPLQALNAMAINGATGYLLYHSIATHFSFIELIGNVTLFHRYWSGNRSRAFEYASQDKIKKDAQLQDEILMAIDEMLE